MRRYLLLLNFFLSIIFSSNLISQDLNNPTFWYYYSLTDLNLNQAEQILLGAIDKYFEEYPLSPISLGGLNEKSLRTLRNVIYARHGYEFKSEELNEYFSKFSWYEPQFTTVEDKLTEIDKRNIDMIKTFENMNIDTTDIKFSRDIIGVWQWGYGMASGWGDRFVFYSETEMEFLFSQMSQLQMIRGVKGSYHIDGNVLFFEIRTIDFYEHSSDFSFSGAFGYGWNKKKINTATFSNPIIMKYPVSEINLSGKYNIPDIMIGGHYFYRMEEDPEKRF